MKGRKERRELAARRLSEAGLGASDLAGASSLSRLQSRTQARTESSRASERCTSSSSGAAQCALTKRRSTTRTPAPSLTPLAASALRRAGALCIQQTPLQLRGGSYRFQMLSDYQCSSDSTYVPRTRALGIDGTRISSVPSMRRNDLISSIISLLVHSACAASMR